MPSPDPPDRTASVLAKESEVDLDESGQSSTSSSSFGSEAFPLSDGGVVMYSLRDGATQLDESDGNRRCCRAPWTKGMAVVSEVPEKPRRSALRNRFAQAHCLRTSKR